MTELNPQITWTPPGRPAWHDGWMTGYVRGLQVILNYLGEAADYDTLMGDLGQAFIMQGEVGSINRIDGAVDVGWWPLEPLGWLRLNFLEQTVGRTLREVILPLDARQMAPAEAYATFFQPVIEASVNDGMPCIVRQGSAWYVITGYDDQAKPLIGMCPNENAGEERIYRIEEPMPPYAMLSVGEPLPCIDRLDADRQALAFAVALQRDQVLGPDASWPHDTLRQPETFEPWWRTGERTLTAYAEIMRGDNVGPHYWHANVKGFLRRNRRSCERYLMQMQGRHGALVAEALREAMVAYAEVLALVTALDVQEQALSTDQGRQAVAEGIEAIAAFEEQAAGALERALQAMG